MKTININKSFLKLLTIMGALSALLLSGCGGGGGGSTQSTLPNEGKAVNSLGFYGDGVYFGSKSIIGTWQVDKPYSQYLTFKSDGTGTIDFFGASRETTAIYGLNIEGSQITIRHNDPRDSSYYYTEISTIELESNDCFSVKRLLYTINNLDDNVSARYCKVNPSATLEPINNTGKTTNTLGYYGEGVKLGNDLVVGNWGSVMTDNMTGGEITLSFDINGSVVYWLNNTYSLPAHTVKYGVSADGKSAYFDANYYNFEIIGLFEGCYLMRDSSGYNHKLCKIGDNEVQ